MRDIASPFDGFASPFGPQRGFNPASLFGSTEGLWFNFADISSLYQDNLAATPLTAPDQSIGLAADRSRVRSPITTAAVAQSSLGLRPKWGRAPKVKRNLLTWTEDFTNGAWTKTGSSVVGRVVTESVAASTHGVSNSVSFAASPSPNTITARFKAGTGTRNIAIRGAGASGSAYAIFSPSTGGYVASGTTGASWSVVGTPSSAVLGSDGYYTASVSVSDTEASGSKTTIIGLTSGMTLSYTGDGVSSVDVRSVMMESGLTPTAYQAVTNAFDMTESGVPSYGFIRPDIVDDVLTATMPAAQTGDVAVFGRTASKIESGISYLSGASFSIGTTTVTGMSAGVLSSVGDVVGVLAIGRALTTAEKATLLAYYQARGAGAWI